jgi:hypothetical protein
VRRLQPPTLAQWTCAHQWRTTTSRPGKGDILRVRYLTCRRCGLKVKTEEQLAVSWGEQELVALVAQAFPEDAVVDMATLKAHGLLGGGLSQLNACLVPHGWQLKLVRDQGRVVGVIRRRMSPEVGEDTNGEVDKGGERGHVKNIC